MKNKWSYLQLWQVRLHDIEGVEMKKVTQIMICFLITNTIGQTLYLFDILGKDFHLVLEITLLVDGVFLGLLLGYGLWVKQPSKEIST